MLKVIPQAVPELIESSRCGMAGSFAQREAVRVARLLVSLLVEPGIARG